MYVLSLKSSLDPAARLDLVIGATQSQNLTVQALAGRTRQELVTVILGTPGISGASKLGEELVFVSKDMNLSTCDLLIDITNKMTIAGQAIEEKFLWGIGGLVLGVVVK